MVDKAFDKWQASLEKENSDENNDQDNDQDDDENVSSPVNPGNPNCGPYATNCDQGSTYP